MRLNQCEARFFQKLKEEQKLNPKPEVPLAQLSLSALRETDAFFAKYTPKAEDIASTDMMLPVRDGAKIKTRLFNSNLPDNCPVLIMYPGCGYFLHLFEINASACSRIAKQANMKVIIMDIRVSPEHALPTAIHDAFDVTKYIALHPNEFGIDNTQIYTGGMSSGAHCATAVAYLLTQETNKPFTIQHQFLLNGFYDYAQPRTSYAEFEKLDALCQRGVTPAVIPHYGLDKDALSSPLISPLKNLNMKALPPTTIIVSEFDGLRSDSEDYFQAMHHQGANVNRIVMPGQTHNTFLLRHIFNEGQDPAEIIAQNIIQLANNHTEKRGSPRI